MLLGLVGFGVGLVLTGMLVSAALRDAHLLRVGTLSAERWLQALESDPEPLAKSFEDRRALFPLNRVAGHLGDYSGPFRIDLYDLRGEQFYTSGDADAPAGPPRPPSAGWGDDNPARGPLATLHETRLSDSWFQFVSVLLPYSYDGKPLGYVHVLIDLSDSAAALIQSFRVIAAITALLVMLAFGVSALLVGQKIRQHQRAQERIRYLSQHDELTGLPNRVAFAQRLSEALVKRRRAGGQIAVMFVDIDKFKEVNDSIGHAAGDIVLQAVAGRLTASVRDSDIVARQDGDEFAVAMIDINGAHEAARLVDRIGVLLRQPYRAGEDVVECSISIGIAMAPSDGDETAALLRHADLALVRAKQSGRNAVRFFERGMDLTFLRRRERENDLRRALERDEFDLLYQPQVWLNDSTLCGHEALVRWRHPVHGKISPVYFISIAEDTELIVPLGEWILRRACEDAARWPDSGKVAVNLSPVQFRGGSVARLVRGMLDESGLDPRRLELEITESLLMWDTETVLGELTKLKDLGVTIAMDDFGTGYSSLSYLSRFPFGKIKIDRSFVRCMHNDEAVNAIVSCIIGLGRSLDVTITAEGVEKREQAEMLRQLGCHQGQGFLYGRPADAEEAARRLSEAVRSQRRKAKGAA